MHFTQLLTRVWGTLVWVVTRFKLVKTKTNEDNFMLTTELGHWKTKLNRNKSDERKISEETEKFGGTVVVYCHKCLMYFSNIFRIFHFNGNSSGCGHLNEPAAVVSRCSWSSCYQSSRRRRASRAGSRCKAIAHRTSIGAARFQSSFQGDLKGVSAANGAGTRSSLSNVGVKERSIQNLTCWTVFCMWRNENCRE